MASPVIEGVAESSLNSAGTSHPVTLPASIDSTDLVLIIMDIGSTSATLNALTGWTESLDEAVANGLKIIRYTGAGVPSDPTFVTSASTRSAQIAYRISGADKTTAPQIATTATGSSATPDPPSITPAGGVSKDYLFIAFFGQAGEEADDDTWVNTPPTNYTPSPPRQKACGTAGTNLGGKIGAAERQLTTGAAQNPGTFGVDVSAAWRAQHIIIHPAADPPNEGAATETVSWVGSATGTTAYSGVASGSISWVGTVTGTTLRAGEPSGSSTWAGSVTGATIHAGSATGVSEWAGATTGTTTHEGSTTGTATWTGSAQGEAPAVGVQEGTAAGTTTWTGTALGSASCEGITGGSLEWVGTVAGTSFAPPVPRLRLEAHGFSYGWEGR